MADPIREELEALAAGNVLARCDAPARPPSEP